MSSEQSSSPSPSISSPASWPNLAQANAFTDSSKVTQVGSISIWYIGDGTIASWADIDATVFINVTVA